MLPFMKKERWQKAEPWVQGTEPQATKDYSQTLKRNGICSAGFRNTWDKWLFFAFHFFPFWTEIPITVILCLSHHYILEVHNLMFGFTCSQLDRNFASELIIPQVSPIPDLNIFFKKIYWLINWLLCWVFVAVLGLSLVAASGGHSSSRCTGLSLSWPLLLWSTGSRRAGSVVVAHGPSCSTACGIFPDQGSNPCPLH